MQEWFWFSLLGAALFGATIAIDKINLNKYFKDPLHIMPLNGLVLLVALAILGTIVKIPAMPPSILISAFLLGVVYLLGNVFYYKALFIEEASNISAFLRVMPIFVLGLGFLFLGERFGIGEYAGVVLLIVGSFGISLKNRFKFEISRPLFQMGIASLFYASYFVMAKYLVGFADYVAVYFYAMLGLAVFSIGTLLWKEYREYAIALTRKHPVKPLFLYSVATVFNLGGEGATFIALSSGLVSLISALQASQALFSVVFGMGLTLFAPHLLREEIDKGTLFRKAIFILLIIIGTYLVA